MIPTQYWLLNKPKSYYKDISDFSTYRACAFFLGRDLKQYTNIEQRPPILFIKRVNQEQTQAIESKRTLIYFHGNKEDLGSCYSFLLKISNSIDCDVYALEYPEYGIYNWKNNNKSKADQMKEDAEDLYEYISKQPNFNPKELIILGRSMGTGLASWLAKRTTSFDQTSSRQLINWSGKLVLISPFQSIQQVIGQYQRFLSYVQKYFEEFFDSEANLEDFPLPTLFIHGKKDKLIKYTQSQQLSKKVRQPSEYYPEDMDHNNFNFQKDIADQINSILQKYSNKEIPSNEDQSEINQNESIQTEQSKMSNEFQYIIQDNKISSELQTFKIDPSSLFL